MNIEKAKEWAEKIPINDLFDELRKITKLSDLKFTWRVDERRGYVSIKYESQDLVEKVGFLKLMFSEIHISEFNSQVTYDEELDQFRYWGTASFRYNHPSGGSNGCNFLDIWYDDIHGWKFEQR